MLISVSSEITFLLNSFPCLSSIIYVASAIKFSELLKFPPKELLHIQSLLLLHEIDSSFEWQRQLWFFDDESFDLLLCCELMNETYSSSSYGISDILFLIDSSNQIYSFSRVFDCQHEDSYLFYSLSYYDSYFWQNFFSSFLSSKLLDDYLLSCLFS